jgi:hypothetical protein
MATNLPAFQPNDSAAGTKLFFDAYGQEPLEFNANEVDACVAFFVKNGFIEEAAQVVSSALLKQAKLDAVPVFQFLETLKNFDNIELSIFVGEILNNNRVPTSTLGFRTEDVRPAQVRNIAA